MSTTSLKVLPKPEPPSWGEMQDAIAAARAWGVELPESPEERILDYLTRQWQRGEDGAEGWHPPNASALSKVIGCVHSETMRHARRLVELGKLVEHRGKGGAVFFIPVRDARK